MALDLEKLKAAAAKVAPPTDVSYPKVVEGRVAHIDADFMAYQVSAESKDELDPEHPTPRKTLEDMQHNAQEAVEYIRKKAGAEYAVLHTTHNSNKGGRDEQAILKPYQANRADRDNKPEQLDVIREFLGAGAGFTNGVFTGMNHPDQEADDGMATAQFNDPANAIVCSADKDLDMVPGLRLDMTTFEITNQKDTFGWIALKDMISPTTGKKYATKVVGRGTKFFWAQMLMGDGADNISGLPLCPGVIWQEYAGTKAYTDLYTQYVKCEDKIQGAKLGERLDKLTAKTKPCGPVLTFAILENARDDKECWNTIRSCYTRLEKDHGYEFKHWNTGKRVTPTQAILSEMRLLWMRRVKDKDDVVNWLKGVLK